MLSTRGISTESIIKFLIANRFHVTSRILNPKSCKQFCLIICLKSRAQSDDSSKSYRKPRAFNWSVLKEEIGKNPISTKKGHGGDSDTRVQPESSITIYIAERQLAHFVYLCHHPIHWLRLLTRALSMVLVSVHIFSFHVWTCVHCAGDINNRISFVIGRNTRLSICFRGISWLRSAFIFLRSRHSLEYVLSH